LGSGNSIYGDKELLLQLKDDSEHAFKLIYNQYYDRIYQTAVRYLKSSEVGQEVVQDVFMKLWLERNDLPQLSSLEAWLYTIAKNNILNRLKRSAVEWKAKRHFTNHTPQSEQTTLNALNDREYSGLLREAIEELPLQQRQVFELARHEKLTYAEIGKKLQISPLTVKTHMSRALQHIRNWMSGRGIEIPLTLLLLKIFF
jgi:RNA polymerase sigma-70 factor (family 1)